MRVTVRERKMPADSDIRPAIPADASAVAACVHAAYQHYVPRIGKPPAPMLDDYADTIRRHRVFVLEVNSSITGAVVLVVDSGRALLDNVAVHPEHQGSGLGRKLIAFAEKEALALGFPAIELYTHELMSENLALYRELGYAEFARETEEGYKRIYMRKLLAPAVG